MPILVASRGSRIPSSIWRSTFSITTMASSTTSPVASVMPNNVSVLMTLPAVPLRAQFGAAHVPQLDQRAVLGALNHNVLELFGVAQPAHGAHADLVRLVGRRGLLSHLSRRHLHVLLAQRRRHVS